jgi:hypothetical protein
MIVTLTVLTLAVAALTIEALTLPLLSFTFMLGAFSRQLRHSSGPLRAR